MRGVGLQTAAFTVSAFTFAGISASLIGELVTNMTGRRKPILLVSGGLARGAAVTAVLVPGGPVLYTMVALTGFLLLCYLPALFSVPLEVPGSTPERAGAITSLIVMAGNATSFLAPVLVGVLRDATGSYFLGLCFVAASSVTLLFATLFLTETGPGRPRSQSA